MGGPFSNASFVGTYAGGNLAPIDANLNNGVNSVTVDGAGGGYSSGDFSGPKGLNQTLGDPVVYNIAPNGRGTIPDGSVVYAISPTKFLVLPTSGTAQVDVYEK